jgi:hypothetical protein
MTENKYLTYEEFGAIGDGKADDMPAIVACHEKANELGLPVKALDTATYYISPKALTANIKTDVDFGKATFIIDDVDVESRTSWIFKILPDTAFFDPDIKTLEKNQKKIDIPHEGNLFVRVFNENKKIFIREGLNMNSGYPTKDVFTVDKDGNITCPIDWNYTEITKCEAKSADDKPITVEGGIFKTIANQQESFYNYHSRGFVCTRCNVTIKNITHLVEGELDHGAPYAGFINVTECANVTVSDCLLTGHFIYMTPSKVPGKLVPMGSYDINVNNSVNITLRRITQTTDIMDNRYWGLIHTNYCKDLLIEDCVMSRYDAHEGVSNITIRGCTLGHQCLNLIGFGEAVIENTNGYGRSFINLRSDFGSFWDGNITIRNCTWRPAAENKFIINSWYTGLHDFGYPCCLPHNVSIDGLKILDGASEKPTYVFLIHDQNVANDNTYYYEPTHSLELKNIISESGNDIIISRYPEFFKDTKIR